MTARIDGKHEYTITSSFDGLKEMQQWCKETFGYTPLIFEQKSDVNRITVNSRDPWRLEMAHKAKFEFRDEAEAALFALTWR